MAPAAPRICPNIEASRVVFLLKRLLTATQTLRNVDPFRVRNITGISAHAPRVENYTVHELLPTQKKTRKDVGGTAHSKRLTETSNQYAIAHRYAEKWNKEANN